MRARAKPTLPWRYYADLAEMAAAADDLMVCCGGGEATRNLVDRRILDAVGPAGVVVNVGRGSVIDEPALIAALQEGRIAGAGLDVFADEPNVPQALHRDGTGGAPAACRQRHAWGPASPWGS